MQNGLCIVPTLDTVINDMFYSPQKSNNNNNKLNRTNIIKLEQGYEIQMEVAGYKKENINIEILDRKLTITLNKKDQLDRKNYILNEFTLQTLNRQFTLPEGVNKDTIDAKLENGILFINLKTVNNTKKITIT